MLFVIGHDGQKPNAVFAFGAFENFEAEGALHQDGPGFAHGTALGDDLLLRLASPRRTMSCQSRGRVAQQYIWGNLSFTCARNLFLYGWTMNDPSPPDPAERTSNRLFYRDWRPTRLGRWVGRLMCWYSGLGLPPSIQAALEVPGRRSGRIRANPVVIATVDGKRYLVSMLGPRSDWVKNVEAAHGAAVIRRGRRQRVHLVLVAPEERAPVLREYVRIAPGGRLHFPIGVGSPLAAFAKIADRYPVYRIDPE